MQDRTLPNTLIELKKLAAESNRFRTEEVPRRLREKQHITRLYKDIEVNRKLAVHLCGPCRNPSHLPASLSSQKMGHFEWIQFPPAAIFFCKRGEFLFYAAERLDEART